MLQDLWKSKASWDDSVPPTIHDTWSKFRLESSHLNAISIPRYLGVDEESSMQLHRLCDASTKVFEAVVYIKNVHNNKVSLVSTKTRVAPIKELIIPKLELSGALLLAELITAIQRSLSVPVNELFLWTDSNIVLGWINKPPIKGNIFIKNRIDKILNLTSKEVWYHIPGKVNPADCATRGLFCEQCKDSVQWWTGPYRIKQDFQSPISSKILITQFEESDFGPPPSSVNVNPNSLNDILLQFSSFTNVI
ncbi:hypothetical protein AVEN_141178-1 [Araneus ventricosus]|uniref:Uncharacterized protein n=1 Tax=Araneus ventricosus TaxID=182803 RepID=A0A4Y2ESK0_ARAVE|nr:hypothetical protein AVEN_141178-1 [Araneus ventricosus]